MILKLQRLISRKQPHLKLFYSSNFKMSRGEKTGVKLPDVISALENFAPKKLAESWDNTGLLVEPYTPRHITKILLTNDLTEDVAIEANDNGSEMIVSYHPPIFAPLTSVTQRTWKQRIVSFLLEKQIAMYSPHTSWDSVQGGVNDWLASAFPFADSRPIVPGEDPNTGAGRILRVETSLTLDEAISRIKKLTGLTHVRIAVGKGRSLDSLVKDIALCAGSGGSVLKNVMDADLFLTGEYTLRYCDLTLSANDIQIPLKPILAKWNPESKLQFYRLSIINTEKIKIGHLVMAASHNVSLQLLYTYMFWEMLHHDVLNAAQNGISVILTNHSDSERGFLRIFADILQSKLDNQVTVEISKCDKDPLTTV